MRPVVTAVCPRPFLARYRLLRALEVVDPSCELLHTVHVPLPHRVVHLLFELAELIIVDILIVIDFQPPETLLAPGLVV
jgi:hypothetical protein